MDKRRCLAALAALLASSGLAFAADGDVSFENDEFRLVIGADARAKSLVMKANGEECISVGHDVALFSTTQERPFNNEIKLAWPNKRTTYQANRLRREKGRLIVGFEIVPYEIAVSVEVGKGYMTFSLDDFVCRRGYGGLNLDAPPVVQLRILQLPVRNRVNMGDWLNVMWDDRAAAAVVAVDPYAEINHERHRDFEVLCADLHKGLSLKGGKAAIVAGAGREAFLDSMDAFERANGLPLGVQSRRDPRLNASILWTTGLTPGNVDYHIAIAKKCGIRMMLIYYTAMTDGANGWASLGNYDWNKSYPRRDADLRDVLAKLKSAGITPGFHTLQTHIGSKSRYVTPVADPRLNIKRRFTVAKDIPASGDVAEIEVLENPVDAPEYKTVRVLKFGGELFTYEKYSTVPPYRFMGVKRGYWDTSAVAHPRGEIGGVLDVSEYGAKSCYIDQRTDLQDEVAEKIARICDAGMEFCYFDGSEGVNPPCGINVSLAQYRVVRKFAKMPIFTEGAAKSHFGWHLQAGANAFDVFPPEVFKKMIVKHPHAEAPIMRKDMTRLDYGWWHLYCPEREASGKLKKTGVQLDMWEFGTSRAAAWDCPVTMQMGGWGVHPRGNDLMEMIHRWEDVRARKWLTPAQKEALKSPTQEHHLYVNEKGEYELHEIEMLDSPENARELRGFMFERGGRRMVAYWHMCGKAKAKAALGDGGAEVSLDVDNLRYLSTDLPRDVVRKAFAAVCFTP